MHQDFLDTEILRRSGVDVFNLLKQLHEIHPDDNLISIRYGARLLETGDSNLGFPLFQKRLLLEDPTGELYKNYLQFTTAFNSDPSSVDLIIDSRRNAIGDVIFFLRILPHLVSSLRNVTLLVSFQFKCLFEKLGVLIDGLDVRTNLYSCPEKSSYYKVDLISAATIFSASSLLNQKYEFLSSYATNNTNQLCCDVLLPFAAEKLRHLLNLDIPNDLTRRSMLQEEIHEFSKRLDRDVRDMHIYAHELDRKDWWNAEVANRIRLIPDDFFATIQLLSNYAYIYAVDSALFHLCAMAKLSVTLILPTVYDWRYGDYYRSGDKLLWYKDVTVSDLSLPFPSHL
ncbi:MULTISPECIES: hypothetical protein [Prochlorococcus]|uniref:hypothetical protein n=1 Tax=Prochlorococcus TaxID=1218 RepID=UPI0007B3EDBB|nr:MULTISPECIES: hypothetical protein [Prochlorococcus]KZR72373.1 hypothetical protein PMIT1312_00047 [Prochlorococcus marinus str. MIT 1312]KZR84577.1 hypothetical protein PMIT1327_00050 [Prochlorococcus marinus str. MIT 1327]NMO84529.1 hypothetical protein [Prochlorococcus sp. P1344]NMP05790.1 hypothetical protein [Prochlorococcus sp. P1361]NMP12980.1 hypothetical protein [Prochlorococcus sp.P1363]